MSPPREPAPGRGPAEDVRREPTGDVPPRPAFYALRSGGWRDLVTLLHPPYTAWNLSYVALGAAAAPHFYPGRLWAALAAFLLAVGISAHAFDELHGRPLRTQLSRGTLNALGFGGLLGAVAIGLVGVTNVSFTLFPLVLLGAVLVPAYNLELFGGRLHNDDWFALAWGAFPAFTGYFVMDLAVRPAGVLVAAACCLLSVAQRRLSTPARELRRRTVELEGEQRFEDGTVRKLSARDVADPLEGALSVLWIAVVLLAAGFVVTRL
jgi:hypothetical protein